MIAISSSPDKGKSILSRYQPLGRPELQASDTFTRSEVHLTSHTFATHKRYSDS